MKRGILWFRNDLRLRDNQTLTKALEYCDQVIPLYILDERYLEKDKWGFVRTGPYRLQFLLESLYDLKNQLKERGSDLIVKTGLPEDLLLSIAQQYQAEIIFAAKEYTDEEIKVEEALKKNGEIQFFHTSTLIHPTDLPFKVHQLPDVFTQFRKRIESYVKVRPPLEAPDRISSPSFAEEELPSLASLGFTKPPTDERTAFTFKGGSEVALKRINHYFWDSNAVSTYKETRNGLIGEDYATRFSPWLANGSISARDIYNRLERYEQEITSNQSTYWVKFELLWRDYFKFIGMKYGRKIFFPGGIQGKNVRWKNDEDRFRKWALGQTGDAFVDANMRELLHSGWMSNRGRQNVASYLVHQLKQDWRKGAACFESLLIDYDVTSNYGNWMYAAGVGNDPRDRVFNTSKQADRYDPNGEFRNLWLGEPSEEIKQ